MLIKNIVIFSIVLLPQVALSQVYKCKTAKGKVIYSEEKCASGTRGEQLDLEENVLDNSAFRNQIAIKKSQQNSGSTQITNSESYLASANQMSTYDKELRLRALKMDMIDQQSSIESREDARNEYRYLNKNSVKSLSYEDELMRRNLKVDLESYDLSKRGKAVGLLNQIYTKY